MGLYPNQGMKSPVRLVSDDIWSWPYVPKMNGNEKMIIYLKLLFLICWMVGEIPSNECTCSHIRQSVLKSSAPRMHVSGHPQKRYDQNKSRKGRSFYNHPTFQTRAGLNARMVFPIQQRHQNVHPCQTAQHQSNVKRKTRRGNRNSAKQRTKFENPSAK